LDRLNAFKAAFEEGVLADENREWLKTSIRSELIEANSSLSKNPCRWA
jgi:hypothetical protein